jgi:hypothetical protein
LITEVFKGNLGVPQTSTQFTALRFAIALALGRVVHCIFANVVSIPPPPLQKMPLTPLTRFLVKLKICAYLRNLREKKICVNLWCKKENLHLSAKSAGEKNLRLSAKSAGEKNLCESV